MFRFLKIFIGTASLMGSTFFGTPSFAQSAATASDAVKDFNQQIQILQQIQPYVERMDLGRLLVIRNSIQAVIQNIESNQAAGKNDITMETMRLLQNLIIQYRFSTSFFGWQDPVPMTSIYAPVIASQLKELQELSKQLENDYGFDDSPYTQVTAQTFRQMHKLLQELDTLPIPLQLKTDLRTLWPAIGETIAIAQLGDRPKTFEKAIQAIGTIRNLYSIFNQIATSAAGFNLVIELQGLSEFYAEYAQVD